MSSKETPPPQSSDESSLPEEGGVLRDSSGSIFFLQDVASGRRTRLADRKEAKEEHSSSLGTNKSPAPSTNRLQPFIRQFQHQLQ